MKIENSHQLLQFLQTQLQAPKDKEALSTLESLLEQIGPIGHSHIDISHIETDLLPQSSPEQTFAIDSDKLSQPVENSDSGFRLFARTTPIRTAQMVGGSNALINGALVQTVGPFSTPNGNQFWLDIAQIQKSVALFMQGDPFPLMYFQTTLPQLGNDAGNIPLLSSYSIDKGTVWLKASFFMSNLPKDSYVGFVVEAGKLDIAGVFTTTQMGIQVIPNRSQIGRAHV